MTTPLVFRVLVFVLHCVGNRVELGQGCQADGIIHVVGKDTVAIDFRELCKLQGEKVTRQSGSSDTRPNRGLRALLTSTSDPLVCPCSSGRLAVPPLNKKAVE